jgi:hypothetical protein
MSNEARIEALDKEIERLEAQTEGVPDNAATSENEPVVETKEPVEVPVEEQKEDTKALLEKYKQEAEAWRERSKKRDADLERGLHGTIKENKELMEKIESLQTQIASIGKPKQDDEEEDLFPEVTAKISPLRSDLDFIKKELASLREERSKFIQEAENARLQAAADKHFGEVKAKHEDAYDILCDDESPLRKAALGWALNRSEEYGDEYLQALTDVMSKSSKFVSRVISDFKKDVGLDKQVAKPSTGDIAVKAGASTKPKTEPAEDLKDVFSESELANIGNLIHQNRNNPDALKAIEEKLERTHKVMGG